MTDPIARASVRVRVAPFRAFDLFTADIGRWWKRGTMYWNDRDRGLRYEFTEDSLLEVYEDGVFEVGRVTAWVPGELLEFGWRQDDWPAGATTTVRIRFSPDGDGTRLELEHSGWEVLPGGAEMSAGYHRGWVEIFGWYEGATA